METVRVRADITFTGKTSSGREVSRIFGGDGSSHITQRPMPRLLRALNPLAQITNPARVSREMRSCSGWLTFAAPIEPPLKAKGIATPEEYRRRITTLTTLIADIKGFNTYYATEQDSKDYEGRVEEDEECSLDGGLLTPSGAAKMLARVENTELLTHEEYEAQRETLEEIDGYRMEPEPVWCSTLSDGTEVYNYQYRVSFDKDIRCRYDKAKCLCGGVKFVFRPIQQLYYKIKGQYIEIDVVISEKTALSKGAVDAFLYPMLAQAGVTEINAEWTVEQLVEIAEKGLVAQGLPKDGRFQVYTDKETRMYNNTELDDESAGEISNLFNIKIERKRKKVKIGEGVCGPLPYCRPAETESRQSSSSAGLSLISHSRLIGGLSIPYDEVVEEAVSKTAAFWYAYSQGLSTDTDSDDL